MAADLAMGDAVCLVQIPFWAPLAERLRERLGWRVVYDCMDEWTNFPGFGPEVLSREEALVRGADATIVSADRLWEKWNGTAPRLILAKNGIDSEHYRALYGPNDLLDAVDGVSRKAVRHPVIGYYGALASWVDAPLLEKIVRGHPEATIVLAGGHFDVDLSAHREGAERAAAGPAALRRDAEAPLELRRLRDPVPRQRHHRGDQPGQVLRVPLRREARRRARADRAPAVRGAVVPGARRTTTRSSWRSSTAALAEPADDPRRAARRRVAEENDWAHRYEAIDAGLDARRTRSSRSSS